MVGSRQRRGPERTPCVHAAGVEGVTRGERAAGRPCESSHICLFVPMKVGRVSLWYLSAGLRYTTPKKSLGLCGPYVYPLCRVSFCRVSLPSCGHVACAPARTPAAQARRTQTGKPSAHTVERDTSPCGSLESGPGSA